MLAKLDFFLVLKLEHTQNELCFSEERITIIRFNFESLEQDNEIIWLPDK